MQAVARRKAFIGVVCGTLIAIAAAFVPHVANSMPLAISKADLAKSNSLVQQARVTVHVGPRHRHRHWRCRWHRGRRICGWR